MIKVENLMYSYPGKSSLPVINQLSFSWPEGSFTGLLGLNGAGKTTLLHILAGLRIPIAGTVTVAGFIPGTRTEDFRRTAILVPEECFLPDLTLEKLAQGFGILYPLWDGNRFSQALKDFRIDKNVPTRGLSTGDQKKAHLSFALGCRATVLLLDEPTNGLDLPSKKVLRSLLSEYLADGGTSVISTHQVRELDNLFDRIGVLHGGHLVGEEEAGGAITDWEEYFFSLTKMTSKEIKNV